MDLMFVSPFHIYAILMDSILERQRRNHEEIEKLEEAMVQQYLIKPRHVRVSDFNDKIFKSNK